MEFWKTKRKQKIDGMNAKKKASELDGCVFKPDIVIKLNITYKHRIISIYQLYSLLFNLL